MTKGELIKKLQELDCPDDTQIRMLQDGEPKSRVDHAYISRDNQIILGSSKDVIYMRKHFPKNDKEGEIVTFKYFHPSLIEVHPLDSYEW